MILIVVVSGAAPIIFLFIYRFTNLHEIQEFGTDIFSVLCARACLCVCVYVCVCAEELANS